MAATTTVRRRDRLYVSRAGRPVGWYDLVTGAGESAPGAESVVRAAVDDWVRRTSPLRRRPLPTTGRLHVVGPRQVPDAERVPSLAATAAGAPAARRARALLDLAPTSRRRRPPQDALPWLQAAHGQRLVGLRLATLGTGWHVWHGVPLEGGSLVDHLVVGPAGVVAVTTRCHPGTRAWLDADRLRVGGQPKTYVRDARRRADAVERVVEQAVAGAVGDASAGTARRPPVQAVLVLAGSRGVEVRHPAPGTVVLAEPDLLPWLQERPAVLAASAVSRLALALDDARRWDVPAAV
ncbi:NERD domain-containing protein [Aquipuribacter nitratireducens]|uniref:NERD domain-containing protein n=1 Tax=Aquipuribacter nitratireducens TaxID=650104 RepID=A0ABW0GST1_9MICO